MCTGLNDFNLLPTNSSRSYNGKQDRMMTCTEDVIKKVDLLT